MSADTQKYTNDEAPQLRARTANGWKNENNNGIVNSNQILDDLNNEQTFLFVMNLAQGVKFYEDQGEENNYQLRLLPSFLDYYPSLYLNGMDFYFLPAHANTSTVPTAQVGKLDTLPIKHVNGEAVQPNEIATDSLIRLTFAVDNQGDRFFILNNTGSAHTYVEAGLSGSFEPNAPLSAMVPFDTVISQAGALFDTTNHEFITPRNGIYEMRSEMVLFTTGGIEGREVREEPFFFLFKNGQEVYLKGEPKMQVTDWGLQVMTRIVRSAQWNFFIELVRGDRLSLRLDIGATDGSTTVINQTQEQRTTFTVEYVQGT